MSELVTNAIRYGRGEIGLGLSLAPEPDGTRVLRIEVSDASPCLPQRGGSGNDAMGGRGLVVVEALSDRWGWHPREDGKTVWVEWALCDTSGTTDTPPAGDA